MVLIILKTKMQVRAWLGGLELSLRLAKFKLILNIQVRRPVNILASIEDKSLGGGMRPVISGKTCPILEDNNCLEGVTTSSGVSRPKYLCAAAMPVHFSGRKACPPVCNA